MSESMLEYLDAMREWRKAKKEAFDALPLVFENAKGIIEEWWEENGFPKPKLEDY